MFVHCMCNVVLNILLAYSLLHVPYIFRSNAYSISFFHVHFCFISILSFLLCLVNIWFFLFDAISMRVILFSAIATIFFVFLSLPWTSSLKRSSIPVLDRLNNKISADWRKNTDMHPKFHQLIDTVTVWPC